MGHKRDAPGCNCCTATFTANVKTCTGGNPTFSSLSIRDHATQAVLLWSGSSSVNGGFIGTITSPGYGAGSVVDFIGSDVLEFKTTVTVTLVSGSNIIPTMTLANAGIGAEVSVQVRFGFTQPLGGATIAFNGSTGMTGATTGSGTFPTLLPGQALILPPVAGRGYVVPAPAPSTFGTPHDLVVTLPPGYVFHGLDPITFVPTTSTTFTFPAGDPRTYPSCGGTLAVLTCYPDP